jgi:hypothetical protein
LSIVFQHGKPVRRGARHRGAEQWIGAERIGVQSRGIPARESAGRAGFQSESLLHRLAHHQIMGLHLREQFLLGFAAFGGFLSQRDIRD